MSDSNLHEEDAPSAGEEEEHTEESSEQEERNEDEREENSESESKEADASPSGSISRKELVLEDSKEDEEKDENAEAQHFENGEQDRTSPRSVREVQLSSSISDVGSSMTATTSTTESGTTVSVSQQEEQEDKQTSASGDASATTAVSSDAAYQGTSSTGDIAEQQYHSFQSQDLPSPERLPNAEQQEGVETESKQSIHEEPQEEASASRGEIRQEEHQEPPLTSRQCVGSFVQRGSNWERYQELRYDEQKTSGASEKEDHHLRTRLLGEDGGTKGRGIIVDRSQVSMAGSRESELLENAHGTDLQVDLVAVLWEYGAVHWYPWSRFDAQDEENGGPDSKIFQVITLSNMDPQYRPDQNLFIAKAVLKCFERNLVPQAHRREGINVRRYLRQRSVGNVDALEGKGALVRMEDRKYWHAFVGRTKDYASLSHLLNILVYTFQSALLPIHWLAFQSQWHHAANNLSDTQRSPETARRKLVSSKLEEAKPWQLFSALPREEQFSSLLREIILQIDKRAVSKHWKRAGWSFPGSFDYSISSSLGEAFSQLSSNKSVCVQALESFAGATSFPWEVPSLDDFTQKLKQSLVELESAIPPQSFQLGFQRKGLSIIGEMRRQFLIMLEGVACPPDLLPPLKLLRYSIIPEGFFEEWILFKGERWYMELQNLESQSRSLEPGSDYSQSADDKMVGSLILELGDNLKEIALWKQKWPDIFDEMDIYYVPYVAPLQSSLHEDLLVHVTPTHGLRCSNSACQKPISPDDPYSCFQTVGGHIHTLGNHGLATESQLDLLPEGFEDRYFCAACVLSHLGIAAGDRVERNDEEWEHPDHDGGKGGLGYVSRVLKTDWIGYVEVSWDARPTEAFSYSFGSRASYEIKSMSFERGDQISVLKDLHEAKVRYDMFCKSIFNDNLASTRISEREWGMMKGLHATVVKFVRCSNGVPVVNIQFDRLSKVFWLPVACLEKTQEDGRVPSRERAKRRSQVQPEDTSYETV